MMHIVLLVLVFFFFVIFLVFGIIRRIVSLVFGAFRGQSGGQRSQENMGSERRNGSSFTSDQQEHGKVFPKDEGEYVSFEEVE